MRGKKAKALRKAVYYRGGKLVVETLAEANAIKRNLYQRAKKLSKGARLGGVVPALARVVDLFVGAVRAKAGKDGGGAAPAAGTGV